MRRLFPFAAPCLLVFVVVVACRRESREGESCSATADCLGELRCVAQVCACQCEGGVNCDAWGNCLARPAVAAPTRRA